MASMQSFWPVSHRDDDFWVCMSCLTEVFYRKVPMPDCPSCHGVSTYEAFTLEAIDGPDVALRMRVIVGRPYRASPEFADRIRFVVCRFLGLNAKEVEMWG